MIWIIVGVLILLAALGAPLFSILGAVALVGFYLSGQDGGSIVASEFNRLSTLPGLIAIPLFTLAGYILAESRTPQRLVRLTNALVGWLPGGLAVVAIVACTLFTAFTGATGVTIIALGAVLYPALRQAQYGQQFSLGLLTASGGLGLLLAPSMPLILYGVIAQQFTKLDIVALFKAGIIPCLIFIALLSAYSAWHVRGVPRARRASGAELWAAVKDMAWEIPLPFVILIGIYSGRLAASEMAAVTALYVLVVNVLIRRELKLAELPRVTRQAMVLVGGIVMILGFSLAVTNYLIDAEVPGKLFELLQTYIPKENKWLFLFALTLFLLVFGMLLEGFPAIILLVPLVLPVAQSYDIDPVHLGIIFLANLQLGIFLPPLGINLYIASARFRQPVLTLVRAAVPFFLIMLAATLIITYWPGLSLWLAR